MYSHSEHINPSKASANQMSQEIGNVPMFGLSIAAPPLQLTASSPLPPRAPIQTQSTTENDSHSMGSEERLTQAIDWVEQALEVHHELKNESPEEDTEQKINGLSITLGQLRSLRGGSPEAIDQLAKPILAAAKGDIKEAEEALKEKSPLQQRSGSGSQTEPPAQRMAQAAALPLVAAGPPGWAVLGVLAIATVAVGVIAYESSKTKTRTQDKVIPRVVPRGRTRRQQMNNMRFQVQWGTNAGGPTFSNVATAPSTTGVTTLQAISTLQATVAAVRPNKAKKAAQTAAAKQSAWIASRPPAGIATGGYSKSEYFSYGGFSDARVDVENLRGHNLKI